MKLKKRLAVLLSAAMVMGMTVPAGATVLSTNEVPGGDSKTGTGTIEDHLDREVANIILPTISDNAFDFTVDPERLVQATQGARFADAGDDVDLDTMDAGVFFLVSENQYRNKTPEFKFENRSTFAIDLTVEVAAQHNKENDDLALLSFNELTNPTEPGVFLGLKVGKDTADFDSEHGDAVKYDTPAKKTVSVNGIESNFKVSWNKAEGYHNIEIDNPQTWSYGKFQIEGRATEGKDITDDTSAPLINVTWSWSKYGEVAYVSSTSVSESSKSVTLTMPDGVTLSSVVLNRPDSSTTVLVEGNHYSLDGTNLTINAYSSGWVGMSITLKFSDNHTEKLKCN